ncbi:type A2 lantipeptide [Streptomyces sp. NPDC000151]|uniref:type A2 lantipeptide n=1 Tax=Streptomyces sp. NPDC000151 TaxID=3154244 RepID=UPI003321A112
MDFTPQVETAEIADAELDNIAGGLGVVGPVANQVVGTVDGVTGGTVGNVLGTVTGTVQGATGVNVNGVVAGL